MSERPVLLAFVCLLAACAREPAAPRLPPNVLLVTIDTLRADRLTPRHMPALSQLAGRGVVFRNTRSVVPLTLPAHASIMTGVGPAEHGVRENGVHRFAGGNPAPLAVRLRARGYTTAAFVGAFVLDRRFGLDAGFETYDDQVPRDPKATDQLEAERPGNLVVDRALGWLDAPQANPKPYFLWVHLYDPHAPYTPPADSLARAGNPYDGEVLFADAQLGRLLAAVDRRGERDRTLVVVVGDHGESLGEHGEATHGMLLYDAALRVPLVVAGPGVVAATRDDPASVLDVAPTVLARTGADGSGTDGVDLLSGRGAADRELHAETDYPRVAGWSPLRALVQDRWKAIVSDETELYDLETDPGELRNLAAERASTARAMTARLGERYGGRELHPLAGEAPVPREPQAASSADAAERLRALGYVASSAPPARPGAGANPARHIAGWVRFEEALGLLSRQPEKAERPLRELALRFPDAPIFQSTWARSLSGAGQPGRALRIYRDLVRRWTSDPVLFHDMAVAAREAGDAKEARRAEEASLVLAPGQAAPHNGLGLLHADAGRHDEARRAFTEAVRLDQTNVTYLVNLGNACRALGNLDDAERTYRAALDREPQASDALNGLGVVLVQRSRAGEAVPYLERALAADPAFVEARLNLGIALQESGQPVRAAAEYREVLRAPSRFVRERGAAAALLKGMGR